MEIKELSVTSYFYCCMKLCLNINNQIFQSLDNIKFFVLKEKLMSTSNTRELW